MNLKRLAAGIYLIVLLFASCMNKEEKSITKQQKKVELFVEYLKENNEHAVSEMGYGGALPDNITNDELRKRDVQRASEMIRKYGIPAKQNWKFQVNNTDGKKIYSATLTLMKKSNTEKAEIFIQFPPAEVSDKIYRYIIISPEAELLSG